MNGKEVPIGRLVFLYSPYTEDPFSEYGLTAQPDHNDQPGDLSRELDWFMDEICYVCNEPFTAREWDERHTVENIYDCHSYCCPECNSADKTNVGSD